MSERQPTRARARALALALAVVFAALALTRARLAPPEPEPPDAPADRFSAGRAATHLRALVGDGAPRPAGSPANARARNYLVATLAGLGYAPESTPSFECDASGTCGFVSNVVASLPGREAGKAVLLTAHYDSVGAGPGACDDGVGVAALLEIARIVKAAPPPRHAITFLFDDSEEAAASATRPSGLRGAKSFLARDPRARDVGAVVNLEARGTSGPSLLFETSDDNAWLVRAFAGAARRPATNSAMATIYGTLANSTDLTVYRAGSLPGLNFAFIGDAARYHTPLDRVERESLASLQHHGDNALAAARALAEADLDHPPPGDAVFFDVLNLAVARWPLALAPALAAAPLALLAALTLLALRARRLRARDLLAGALPLLAAAAAALLAEGLARLLLAAGAMPSFFVAHPGPALLAFWALPFAALALAAPAVRRAGPLATWCATWLLWSLVGLALSLSSPALSYPFVAPPAVAALAALAALPWARGRFAPLGPAALAAALAPLFAACVLLFPIALVVHDAVGTYALSGVSALVALALAAAAPLLDGLADRARRAAAAIAALVVAAAATAVFVPPYSESTPQGLSVALHHDASANASRWLVSADGPPPADFRAAFEAERPAFPWGQRPAFAWWADDPRSGPAPRYDAPAPELADLERSVRDGRKHLRATLRSPRGAPVASLFLPPGAVVASATMGGRPLPSLDERLVANQDGWRALTCDTLPPEGVDLALVLEGVGEVEAIVVDRSPGLPPAAAETLPKRPPWTTPRHEGDGTVVSRRIAL